MINRDKDCLSYWYPIIKDLVPTPKTKIIKTDVNLIELCDGKTPQNFTGLLKGIHAAAEAIGYPVFLRTGHTSGKHEWENTCFLESASFAGLACKISYHVTALVEYSMCADMMGLPHDVWVVRELLPTNHHGLIFHGDMPLVQEIRMFVEGENIKHIQPYWPPELLSEEKVEPETIKAINQIDMLDLWSICKQTITIGKAMEGCWSVDWLNTTKGWYMIDMARGELSYRYERPVKKN